MAHVRGRVWSVAAVVAVLVAVSVVYGFRRLSTTEVDVAVVLAAERVYWERTDASDADPHGCVGANNAQSLRAGGARSFHGR